MYSATAAPGICLRAVSNRANPIRLSPLFSSDTLGANTGPLGRLLMTSGSVRPWAAGKSSARAEGWGCSADWPPLSRPLSDEPQPAASTGASSARARSRRRGEWGARGMGAGQAIGLIGYRAPFSDEDDVK